MDHIVAMDLTVSSFMSTNNVREVTKNSRKNVFFRNFVDFWLDMYIIFSKQRFPYTRDQVNHIVAVHFTVSSFMSTNDVQEVTKN